MCIRIKEGNLCMNVPAAYRLLQHMAVCSVLLLAAPVLWAQSIAVPTPSANVPVKLPEYDVVSIKPNKTGVQSMSWSFEKGNLSATNITLKMLVLWAWNLKDVQLVGLPKWGDSAHFDIRAKVVDPDEKLLAGITPEQNRAMEQPILIDRFQLKYHYEKKMLPVYDLVVAKGGPKFKKTTDAEMTRTTGVNGIRAGGFLLDNGSLAATAVSPTALADVLSGQVERIVVDKTGLADQYNFKLNWTPDDAGPPAVDASSGPDFFTALQEQLGLKLEPGKAEEKVFVIDHVALPSED
jgi:uncharacterized protein (TIGR03435 family)